MIDGQINLKGVFAAALTPQRADGRPDLARVVTHARWLLANGCDGLGVLGTTGEANSFAVDERMAILDALIEAGIPGTKLMPGTGCCAITDSITLTRHAVKAGAAGVLMLPPFYYKGVGDDGLFAAFARVIEEVGDERSRVYLYHFPQMSAVPFSFDLIERLLKRYPKTVAGMKDSSGDLANMSGAAKRFPGFEVFAGADDLFLPLLKAGGVGCITACANIVSAVLARILAGWKKGDVAADHERATRVRKACAAHPLVSALKEVMARHTGDAAWRNMRPPLMPLRPEAATSLMGTLAAANFTPPPPP